MSERMQLGELGEFRLIDKIAAKVRQREMVKIGIGDDAAAILPSPGHVILTSTDMLVEGVHFDLNFSDPYTLGKKSLSVNLSDIAAMGGKPCHFLLTLAIPSHIEVAFIDQFIDGILDRADAFEVDLIGGDTCASNLGFVIAITIMGEQRLDRVIRRQGAKPGDLVLVTGTIGDSALGLELLRQGQRDQHPILRHLDPTPRVVEGIALAESGMVTAMIDISDGLLADLGHILDASGTGARLWLGSLPLSSPYREITQLLAIDPVPYSLCGGEDYELLFTIDPGAKEAVINLCRKLGCPVTHIGQITDSQGISILQEDGALYHPPRMGYDHFKK